MPAPPADALSQLAKVISVEPCGDDGVLLRVRPDIPLTDSGGPTLPNRFFMLRREDDLSPAIPRPFSIYRELENEVGGLDALFLIKVMGPGTTALAETRPGEKLRLIGPLGLGWPDFAAPATSAAANMGCALEGLSHEPTPPPADAPAGMPLPADDQPWVFLAGGIGSAPFYMAVEAITRASEAAEDLGLEPPLAPILIYGAATKGLVYDLDEFAELDCALHVCTDDGSLGFHGNVLQLLDQLLADGLVPAGIRLAACGPMPMLRAASRWAAERDLVCWVSLEEMMGCGVGICNGCIVHTEPDACLGAWPNVKACVDGPTFRTDAIQL